MAIQDDFTIDVVDRKITYTTSFVDDRPPSIYTVNEFYSWLQDTFDEPSYMQYSVPMSAQTPTQYTMINGWFIDDNSIKALYGGSIQTSGWTYVASPADGITALRWDAGETADAPQSGDIGVTLTGGTSTATGVLLYVDTTDSQHGDGARNIAWVRNTNGSQFQDDEQVTGTGVDMDLEATRGWQNGETEYANLFSVGSLQTNTEIYVGQEDDFLGGRAYHGTDAEAQLARRIEKVDEWWDSDVDFATGSPNLLGGAGHFDILIKVFEAGAAIDGRRLAVYARQFSKIYSHFELVGGVGNFVVPFASTGSDLNSQDGAYNVGYDAGSGTPLVGDVVENDTGTTPVGRLRLVITAVNGTTSGDIDFFLIGENENLANERTLRQVANNEQMQVRTGSGVDFDIDTAGTALSAIGPGTAQGITFTFGNAQYDIDEDTTDEEYACVIDCNNVPLADVYKRAMFLVSRGNQDGTVADTQDTLLESAATPDESSEFYRASGDLTVPWDGRTGTAPAEGSLVTNANSSWTASGIVVALSDPTGSSGQLTLTQVKGTWSNNDTVANVGSHGLNEVTINGTPDTIVDNTGAPFGTFAGGRWFVARGVVLDNVPTADANNWETVDLGGNRIVPPAVRQISFGGLATNDRATIFEVDTAGQADVTFDQDSVGADAALAATSITTASTIALDVPTSGWVRVADVSSTTGQQYRYEYSSASGTTVTFRTGAGLSGTTTSAGDETTLNDTGAFTNFGTDGNVKIGHMIRKTVSGAWAVVLRKIDNDSIETTPLTGAETWGNSIAWTANTVVVALEDATPGPADTLYFPFIDDVASGSSLSSLIKYVEDTPVVARARFSDPDVGGTRILPFQQTSLTITDADFSVTAIRTADSIASP